jgi:hypothetical protein
MLLLKLIKKAWVELQVESMRKKDRKKDRKIAIKKSANFKRERSLRITIRRQWFWVVNSHRKWVVTLAVFPTKVNN